MRFFPSTIIRRFTMRIANIVFIAAVVLCCAASSYAQLTPQWTGRFSSGVKGSDNGAVAMAIDDSGNVCVTGFVNRKNSGYDIATIVYSPLGAPRWTQYYTSAGDNPDKPVAVTVDTGGNFYVLGSTLVSDTIDYITLKYSPTGSLLWSEIYNGHQGTNQPVGIAVGDSLNVYVTGYSEGAGTGFDFLTIKYSPTGAPLWTNRFDGPAHGDDRPYAMALYSGHALYITGSVTDTMLDYMTIKYDAPTGNLVWSARYNNPHGNGDDIARAIVIHGQSDVFVTGGSWDSTTGYDYATIDYDTSGALQWISRYDGGPDDQAYAIALDGTSRLYVTGTSVNVGTFNGIVTVKYAYNSGAQGWVSTFNGSATNNDYPIMITGGTDPYVLGATTSTGIGLEFALIKYNGTNGSQIWDALYNGGGNTDDIPGAIGLSGTSVYVTGKATDPSGKGNDFVTIDYADPNHLYYRSFPQDSLTGKANSLKTITSVPNNANVRDAAFDAEFPKIKAGNPGAPGYMTIGDARPDSATVFGWILVTKSTSYTSMLPDTGAARGFDVLPKGAPFVGQQKDLKNSKFNDRLVGDLMALKINIAASDAQITPPGFGDLIYNDGDTSNYYEPLSLRQLSLFVDNILTYWRRYPTLNFVKIDSMLIRTNNAFSGRLVSISAFPSLAVTGAVLIDSVSFLAPGVAPTVLPKNFLPRGIVETPQQFTLYQNYPNPFNPTTTISFDLPRAAKVTVTIYDILGREVLSPISNQQMSEGKQQIVFNGSTLASGVYFYRMIANSGEFVASKKMVMVK
jgi:hypothetical protein